MEHWIENAVIYQVNLRSLALREPRNAIEATGEIELRESALAYLDGQLDTLRSLGANVLYLMPPYPIGQTARKGIGSPYSIRDFMAIDPEYGNLDELGSLVRHAHAIGWRIILDITPNHTSRDHVWTSSHRDYYVRTPDGDLSYDADWSDTAKLDYRNPDLCAAMRGVFSFWLGFLGENPLGTRDGVDGFRLDMAHIINNLDFWNETIPALKSAHPDRDLLFLAECYGTSNNLDLFRRGINAAYDDDFYKVCRYGYAVDASGESVVSLAPDAAGQGDFADKRDAFRTGGIAGAMTCALMNYETALPPSPSRWLARYTDNHDEGRGVYRFGPGATRAINTLLFLSPHTLPFLLTGQEFGAVNRPPIHDRLRPCDKGRRIVAHGTIRTEEGVECETNVFARGTSARRAWHTFYRDLIRLRLDHPALRTGTFVPCDAGERAHAAARTVVAFDRVLGPTTLRCAVNLGPEPRHLAGAFLHARDPIYGGLPNHVLPPFGAVVSRLSP